MSKFTTSLSDDGQSFTLRGKDWFNTYPISELDSWLAFYRMMKREHPKSGDNYDAPIAALERLKSELS